MSKIGDRVGAILGQTDKKTVEFLGYGVYEGDVIPAGDGNGISQILKSAGVTNPRILLDNGDVVWGYECWWGSATAVKNRLEALEKEGWTVVPIRIGYARQRHTEGEE